MTPTQLAIVRAIRSLRAERRRATLRSISSAVKRSPQLVAPTIARLRRKGIVACAAFLGDEPRGIRLTGKGKALFEQADVYRRDQAGQ